MGEEGVSEEAVVVETPVWGTGILPAKCSLEGVGTMPTSMTFRTLSAGIHTVCSRSKLFLVTL